jgi:hypothetical protein
MSGYGAVGGLAAGLATGLQLGQGLRLRDDENRRREEKAGLEKRALTLSVEKAERDRADEDEMRNAGMRAIQEAMGGQNAPGVPAAPSSDVQVTPYVDPASGLTPKQTVAPSLATSSSGMDDAAPRTPTADHILKGLEARTTTALQRGRLDLGLQSFNQEFALRTQLRNQALDEADAQYKLTGDLNAYVRPYNDYVRDGTKIMSLRQNPDGSVTAGWSTADGQAGEKVVPKAEVSGMLATLRDPVAMRKLEAQMRLKQFEERSKVHSIPQGGAVATGAAIEANGGIVSAPKERSPKDSVVVVPGAEGEGSRVVRLNPDGSTADVTPGGQNGRGAAKPPPFRVSQAMMDIARDFVAKPNPDDPSGKKVVQLGDEPKVSEFATRGERIMQGAKEAGAQLSHIESMRIATQGVYVPDLKFRQDDGREIVIPGMVLLGADGKIKTGDDGRPAVYPFGGVRPRLVSESGQAPTAKPAAVAPMATTARATPRPTSTTSTPAPAPSSPLARRPASTPEYVSAAGLSPRERAQQNRAQAQQERETRRQQSQKQATVDAFRALAAQPRFGPQDVPFLEQAIASGHLDGEDLSRAREMLVKVNGGGLRKR